MRNPHIPLKQAINLPAKYQDLKEDPLPCC